MIGKPVILISVSGIYGHAMPLRAIGRELIAREHTVIFVTTPIFKKKIESIGAGFIPVEGAASVTPSLIKDRNAVREGEARVAFDMEHFFVNVIPDQHAALQTALKSVKERYPERPVVLLNESFYLGYLPLLSGAPGLRPTTSISIGILPIVLRSVDTPGFGLGLLPEDTPKGRARNAVLNKAMEERLLARPNQKFKEILTELGVSGDIPFFLDAPYLTAEHFLQMSIPSMEYKRSDAPATLHFAGGLPRGLRDEMFHPPSWWAELREKADKKVVAVCQGTVNLNYTELVVPTMQALQDHADVLVVVALGRQGAVLPEEISVPTNVRVVDFIPFDDLLPYCDVLVSNGGYGGVQHAVSCGTPMILAGETEDKPEVAARAEMAGVAVNLRTRKPSPEKIKQAVEEILANEKYKNRSKELQEEVNSYDPIGVIEASINRQLALQVDS